jgi:hypothetical protein
MSDQFDQNDNQLDGFEEPPAAPGPRPGPRPFVVAMSILGGIFVLALIVLIAVMVFKPGQNGTTAEVARRNTENTQIAQGATEAARAAMLQETVNAAATQAATSTPIVVVSTGTIAPAGGATSTSVVAIATVTNTQAPTATLVPVADQTKTAAALTQVALGTKPAGGSGTTPTAGTPTATKTGLPATGFADQVGLPAMVGAAALLLVVIFIARRLRMAN